MQSSDSKISCGDKTNFVNTDDFTEGATLTESSSTPLNHDDDEHENWGRKIEGVLSLLGQ